MERLGLLLIQRLYDRREELGEVGRHGHDPDVPLAEVGVIEDLRRREVHADDDRGGRRRLMEPELTEQRPPLRLPANHQVEDDEGWFKSSNRDGVGVAVVQAGGGVALIVQDRGEQINKAGVVIDDEDAGGQGGCLCRGRRRLSKEGHRWRPDVTIP